MFITLILFSTFWIGCSLVMAVGRITKKFLFPWEEYRLWEYNLEWFTKTILALMFAPLIFIAFGVGWIFLTIRQWWDPGWYEDLVDRAQYAKNQRFIQGLKSIIK